jgi:hypothetical protein
MSFGFAAGVAVVDIFHQLCSAHHLVVRLSSQRSDPMRRSLATALVALCAGAFASVTHAQDIEKYLPKANTPCAGELEKRHQNEPPWDFTTNSKKPTSEQPSVYLHCIFNNAPNNVLDVNWLIPGVKQPIPGNRSAIGPKYSGGTPLGIPDGCLIFGNLRDKSLKAQFWARREDEGQLQEEKGKDCLSLQKTGAREDDKRTAKLNNIVAPFRMFLHADPSSQSSALVAFEGITGIQATGSRSYQSYITYRLKNAQDAPLTDFESPYLIAPVWEGELKVLLISIVAGNKSAPVPLLASKEPTTLAFEVNGSDDWIFRELQYVVLDKKTKRIAGSVFSPVFIPTPQR